MKAVLCVLVVALFALAHGERSSKLFEPNEYEDEAKQLLSTREAELVEKFRSKQATPVITYSVVVDRCLTGEGWSRRRQRRR